MKRRTFFKVAAAGALAGAGFLKESKALGIAKKAPNIRTKKATMGRKDVAQFLNGPIMSLCPSFNKDGTLDFDGVRKFIDHSIAGGSKTILMTAGDTHLICLSQEDNAQLTKVVCEHTAGRAMVVAADWEYRTLKAIEFAKYARSVGADVVMLKPPAWSTVTRESLSDHYAEVSKYLPVMIVTGYFSKKKPKHTFGLDTIRMAMEKSDKVVSVKDDICGEFAVKLSEMLRDTEVVAFAGGLKQNHMNMFKHGCGSCYMSTFQVFAPQVKDKYWNAIQAGDIKAAQAVIDEYEKPFFDFITDLPCGWNPALHGVLALYGINKRWLPKPYVTISDEEMERLTDFLRSKSIL